MRKYIFPTLGLTLGLCLSFTLGACDGDDDDGGGAFDAVAACEDFVDAWNDLDCDDNFDLDKAEICDPENIDTESECSTKAASDCVLNALGCYDLGAGTTTRSLDPDNDCPVCN